MGANGRVALRLAQEVDFLAQVGFGFVDTGHVGKGGRGTLFGVQFGTTAPDAKEASRLLQLTHTTQGYVAKVEQEQDG
jgi:hypothetical protein